MRYAILGYTQNNLVVFEAVLNDIEARRRNDQMWCLGQVVGYEPKSHGCVDCLRRYNHICVADNNDWVAVGKTDTSDFNPDAVWAC